jgi:hypothetical protein
VNCQRLMELFSTWHPVLDCELVRNGMLRFATPFCYPDGSKIDLFIGTEDDLFGNVILTDLGQTTAFLEDMQIKAFGSKRRRGLVADICDSLGVQRDGGQFMIRLQAHQHDQVPDATIRLSQACIRVADLIMTQRLQTHNSFFEELENFMVRRQLPHEPGVSLPGRFGEEVKIDYHVQGRTQSSLMETLSTTTGASAHALATETFRRWFDLAPRQSEHQFVTVYDSTPNMFRPDDLARLNEFSLVLGFPHDESRLYEALAA